MKTYRQYEDLPPNCAYIGGSYPDGTIDLATIDAVEDAIAPVCLIDDADGTRHYFETARDKA